MKSIVWCLLGIFSILNRDLDRPALTHGLQVWERSLASQYMFLQRGYLQKIGLYSVVVSTLVFEMVHISKHYRWPGFEPQYDLSFLSAIKASRWDFTYTIWKPYISALKWCISCLNWTDIGRVMWPWSGRKQIQTKTFCQCCWCYLWREIPRRMKEPLLRFNFHNLLLYLQTNVRSRSMTFRFEPSTTFRSAAVL